jgi:hypothetical protein
MRPQFDERDSAILAERQRARDALSLQVPYPLEGDLVDMPDGTQRRVTHVWDHGDDPGAYVVQLTVPEFDASFYLCESGHMEFSGSLDRGRPARQFVLTGTTGRAPVWFFHHGHVCAHNGVHCFVTVRRWQFIGE